MDDERIARLEAFKQLLLRWSAASNSATEYKKAPAIRSTINQEKTWVRQQAIEAGCFGRLTIQPPPMIGGLIMRNVDPFETMFEPPYGANVMGKVYDLIDATIGVLRTGPLKKPEPPRSLISEEIRENYAFVAMPMDRGDSTLEDVLDAIKEAALRCGIEAERIDDPPSSARITDRILESITVAEFVIADLTGSKPNVYFEAGYAHALGKLPIYVAREGTKLEFDLKDYPVIFFSNLRQLKDELERRLRGVAKQRQAT